MTDEDIIIRYSGLPFYGYEGYRMVSYLINRNWNWDHDFSASVTCERMQDESSAGYTEERHQERLHCSQRNDARMYDAWLKEKEKYNQ